MSSRNPSTMLAESLGDFSKAAYKVFTELENQARQEVANAVAETREARAERDDAMKDLRLLQADSQSWKEDAASSKAALAQAELRIAAQAENLVNQLETITQLRRELNQWKDQAKNWQEHFLRVESERCAQFSRIDEFIIEKLEKLQYAARPGTSANALFTPKTPMQINQINSAPSSTTMKASPRHTQPPAYRPNPESATPEETLPNRSAIQAPNSTNINPPPESGSRRPKPKLQLREGALLQGTIEKAQPNGRKPRKSDDNNHATGTTSAQSHSQQQPTPSAHSNIRSTVIRRVQAVVDVKCEEDDVEESGGAIKPSPPPAAATDTIVVKRRNEDRHGPTEHSRKKSRRWNAIGSDDDENEVQSQEEENRVVDRGVYKLRHTSRINYREEDDNDEEEDELMMGVEEKLDDELYARSIDHPRQQAAASALPRKRRRYSLR